MQWGTLPSKKRGQAREGVGQPSLGLPVRLRFEQGMPTYRGKVFGQDKRPSKLPVQSLYGPRGVGLVLGVEDFGLLHAPSWGLKDRLPIWTPCGGRGRGFLESVAMGTLLLFAWLLRNEFQVGSLKILQPLTPRRTDGRTDRGWAGEREERRGLGVVEGWAKKSLQEPRKGKGSLASAEGLRYPSASSLSILWAFQESRLRKGRLTWPPRGLSPNLRCPPLLPILEACRGSQKKARWPLR